MKNKWGFEDDVCVSDRNSGALNGLSSSENADAKNLRVKVRAFVFS